MLQRLLGAQMSENNIPRRNLRFDEVKIKPRPPGRFWAYEVIAKHKRGEPVSIAALEMAQDAIKHDGGRQPGADDE